MMKDLSQRLIRLWRKKSIRQLTDKDQKYLIDQRPKTSSQRSNSGQVVLLLVLVTVVGLTIGLSLISRTITDIRISSQIEQSNRAFSAAEAGVETALKGAAAGGPTGTVNLPGASAEFDVKNLGGDTSVYYFPYTAVGKAQTLWLMDHESDGSLNPANPAITPYPIASSLDICWKSNPNGVPAMVMTLLYKDGTDYKIAKAAYDPSTTTRAGFDITDPGVGFCDGSFNYKKTVIASDFSLSGSGKSLIALRLQPVYADTSIAVKPATDLPVQGKQISSMGQTETGVIRKIEVVQGYFTLPEMFNFTYFSKE